MQSIHDRIGEAGRSISTDTRAVAGMPIRLVVAVAVGAAALGLILPMVDTVERSAETEVTVELDPRQFALDSGSSGTVTVDVVTEDGRPVTGATVLVSGRSLPVEEGPVQFRTGRDSSSVAIEIGDRSTADVPVTFRPTQTRGTLVIDVVLPPGTEYTDDRRNPEITVRRA